MLTLMLLKQVNFWLPLSLLWCLLCVAGDILHCK